VAFEMRVVGDPPLTGEMNVERVAKLWMERIGYTAKKGPDHGLSFKILYECFLLHPTNWWTVDQLAANCSTSMPSIYRHLNKLKDLDLIEDDHVEVDGDQRRAFRLRYGDLAKAWNHAEVHFQHAMDAYRSSVDHLEDLLKATRHSA
jgi:predicted transcriptional regulator